MICTRRRVLVLALAMMPMLWSGCSTTPESDAYWKTSQDPWQSKSPKEVLSSQSGSVKGESTTLEQLHTVTSRLKVIEQERDSLEAEVTSLTETVHQLRSDNESMQQLVDSMDEQRRENELEYANLRAEVEESREDYRQLADDLLAERIQRVRVERELVLSKIAEAEASSDG